jgi:class 3 adenylate cyclase/tetratricopeptide (TPR) repeat protein
LITCAACGAQSPPGQRFCGQCGSPLAHACPSCGIENPPENRFCGSCGTPLVAGLTPPAAVAQATIAERRLVTVLFADLVGFTSLSEHRDPEEVRDLLSKYFDRCRTLIERYGGTVEKFIGDAVMAVWGTPVAREDDAERAVRAALALTQTVTLLGEEVGMPELRVRAGVLTGNAAVELGAESEGMVLGDTVNTASRLQSIASPGTVLVDDATRRASEAAIAYEDAGTHEVKGREQPVRAWTALRVVAGAGGARRTAGLEAPFVGREHELQAVIDTGEASAHEGRARQVTIVGEPGAGKSRLLWEFFKYLDGIEELRYWHQGRCLSYGEGVAYWALAEMVRARARIQEEEDPATAREKLRSAVEEFVPDERERRLVEPRLAHLLRLEDRPDADRVDLFSGWRLFFERMAEDHPVILAFEDLQWAESGLLDFIDYLLEWSADYPIFVIALGRSELRERRPSWQSLVLAPLESGEIASILEGLAPGLPDELVADIAHGAEGIPLYAVETIRMLQDRGVLTQEGSSYTVTGDVSDLDVPETLQALVASRLDGLSSAERTLLQDASVLGQSFTAAAAAAVNGMPEAEVGRILDGLVAKQVLGRDDDPRSPERGQYVFLQALLRTVAYGTLSRKARKSRHVAAARHLERTWPGEARDIAEVLASHYLEAIRTEPDADDVATLRASARDRLSAAGRAAASLALGPEAQRYFEHAAELADDDLDRAELFEQAGRALRQSGDTRGAEERLRRAIELRQKRGIESGGMAAAVLASIARYAGRLDEAQSLLEPFRSEDCGVGPIERAEALADLGAVLVFGGDVESAPPLFEEALLTLELEEAWPQLTHALVARSVQLVISRRKQEGIGVLRQALALATEHDLSAEVLRAHTNLGQIEIERDRFTQAVDELNSGLARARERGDRFWERQLSGNLMVPLTFLGRWDEASKIGFTLIAGDVDLDALMGAMFMAIIASARGDESTLERCRELGAGMKDSSYVDQRACALLALGREALERGDPVEALGYSKEVIGSSAGSEGIEEALAQGIEATIALGDTATIGELIQFVTELPKARATPLLRAGRARLQAEMAHRGRDIEAATRHEDEAIGLLRSVSARPLLARTLLERHRRSGDAGALAEARLIYTELGATRWLARIDESSEVVA